MQSDTFGETIRMVAAAACAQRVCIVWLEAEAFTSSPCTASATGVHEAAIGNAKHTWSN
jgi:hypothetical protein